MEIRHVVRVFALLLCIESFVLVVAVAMILPNLLTLEWTASPVPFYTGLALIVVLALAQFAFAIKVWRLNPRSDKWLLRILAVEVLLGGCFLFLGSSLFLGIYAVGFLLGVYLFGLNRASKQLFIQEAAKKR